MFEVIYISPSCKQAERFIIDLAEKLKSLGIDDFELEQKNLRLKTGNVIVSAVDIWGGQLGRSHHMTEYYMDKVSDADYPNERVREIAQQRLKSLKCSFRDGTKGILEEELIGILTEVSAND